MGGHSHGVPRPIGPPEPCKGVCGDGGQELLASLTVLHVDSQAKATDGHGVTMNKGPKQGPRTDMSDHTCDHTRTEGSSPGGPRCCAAWSPGRRVAPRSCGYYPPPERGRRAPSSGPGCGPPGHSPVPQSCPRCGETGSWMLWGGFGQPGSPPSWTLPRTAPQDRDCVSPCPCGLGRPAQACPTVRNTQPPQVTWRGTPMSHGGGPWLPPWTSQAWSLSQS